MDSLSQFLGVLVLCNVAARMRGSASLTARSYDQYLQSPGYPDDYKDNLDCKWIITTNSGHFVKVTVLDAGMKSDRDCTGDKVKIYDGSTITDSLLGVFCGGNNYIVTSTNQSVMVRFQTDASGGGRGFNLSYQAVFKPSCPQKKVNALRTYTQAITYPRFSPLYPDDADCSWIINVRFPDDVVYLKVTYLDIEYSDGCYKDFLKAIDDSSIYGRSLGKWCGTQRPPVARSSWQYMLIQFHSNGNTKKSGFRLQYSAINSGSNDIIDFNQLIGITLASIGGFVLLVFAICVASCRAWTIRRAQSERHGVRTTSEQTPRSTAVFVVDNHNAEDMTPAAFTGPKPYDEVITNDQEHRAGTPPPYSSVAGLGMPVNNPSSEMSKHGQTAVVDEPESVASDIHLNTTRDTQGLDNLPPTHTSFKSTSDVPVNTFTSKGPIGAGHC